MRHPTKLPKSLGYAVPDIEREKRCGRAEVIFGEGKLPAEVAGIAMELQRAGQPVLATRVGAGHYEAVRTALPTAVFHERARCIVVGSSPPAPSNQRVGVLCAGTSDLPVAEETVVSLNFFGRRTRLLADLGVAGLHRLLSQLDSIRSFSLLIVVAGMEGALPSVVAGLVRAPVIAVPTSVGYGAGAGGIAALLGMLSSCASGLTVVNIDNGFGAAAAADRILALGEPKPPRKRQPRDLDFLHLTT